MVRANHIDEIAAEKAQRLLNEQHPTIRSGTGGLGSGSHTQQKTLASDDLPQDWARKVQTLGGSDKDIQEFCQMAGISVEQYYADLAKAGQRGPIISG